MTLVTQLQQRLQHQGFNLKATPEGAAAFSICNALDHNKVKFGLEPVHALNTQAKKQNMPMEYLLRPQDEHGNTINLIGGLNFLRKAGFSSQFDMAVIPKAIAQARAYGDAGLPLSVNITPESLQDPFFLEDLTKYLTELRTNMHNPEAIVFEIPLTGHTKAETIGWLQDIQRMGFRITVDNFGQYQPLEFDALRALKPALLKIDGQCIHSALSGEEGAALHLRTLINGVRTTSPKTRLIAPWVATIAQAKRLHQVFKVDAVQGRELPKDRAYFSSEWAFLAQKSVH